MVSAQLWKLTKDSKLENGYASSWEFANKSWELPQNGTEVYIKEKNTGLVLTVVGSKIELKMNNSSENQKWKKSIPDSNDWFTLENPSTHKFLTNKVTENDKNITIVESKKIVCFSQYTVS